MEKAVPSKGAAWLSLAFCVSVEEKMKTIGWLVLGLIVATLFQDTWQMADKSG